VPYQYPRDNATERQSASRQGRQIPADRQAAQAIQSTRPLQPAVAQPRLGSQVPHESLQHKLFNLEQLVQDLRTKLESRAEQVPAIKSDASERDEFHSLPPETPGDLTGVIEPSPAGPLVEDSRYVDAANWEAVLNEVCNCHVVVFSFVLGDIPLFPSFLPQHPLPCSVFPQAVRRPAWPPANLTRSPS
jgi:hypothetical protein